MLKKTIFFEEAYKKNLLQDIAEGYIFSLSSPNFDNFDSKMDPFLLQMISYNGLKTVIPLEREVKLHARGNKMYCMLEPANYSSKHVEPISRSIDTTAHIPYRFNECDIFFTKDVKFRVIIPKSSVVTNDSFTIDFPERGDICVLYYIFDKTDINGKVLPFIEENIAYILKSKLPVRNNDAKDISKKILDVIKGFNVKEDR